MHCWPQSGLLAILFCRHCYNTISFILINLFTLLLSLISTTGLENASPSCSACRGHRQRPIQGPGSDAFFIPAHYAGRGVGGKLGAPLNNASLCRTVGTQNLDCQVTAANLPLLPSPSPSTAWLASPTSNPNPTAPLRYKR